LRARSPRLPGRIPAARSGFATPRTRRLDSPSASQVERYWCFHGRSRKTSDLRAAGKQREVGGCEAAPVVLSSGGTRRLDSTVPFACCHFLLRDYCMQGKKGHPSANPHGVLVQVSLHFAATAFLFHPCLTGLSLESDEDDNGVQFNTLLDRLTRLRRRTPPTRSVDVASSRTAPASGPTAASRHRRLALPQETVSDMGEQCRAFVPRRLLRHLASRRSRGPPQILHFLVEELWVPANVERPPSHLAPVVDGGERH
jgi:hypothetical protein